ncbi:hypothetical protein HDV06_006682 [Boothiomyces sp. JEL0866]|nr:hypothetical protein HDV06_006682 [Boothiomyces sp. JEL0866]
MSVVVYHLNNSRSQRIIWLLQHLQVDYEIKAYDMDPVTRRAPAELKQIHPLGRCPMISHNGRVIAETGAVIEYLVETFTNPINLLPKSFDDKLQVRFWIHFAEGSAMTDIVIHANTANMDRDELLNSRVFPRLINIFGFIEQHLKTNEWFAGEFSGADIAMSLPIEIFLMKRLVDIDTQAMERWAKRIHEMPSCKQALDKVEKYIFVGKN